MKETSPTHPLLESMKQLLPGLSKAFGENTEFVLHDLSHPEDSLIAISGNITHRPIGAPLTSLILEYLQQGRLEEDLINYPGRINGKELKSSTILIRDETGALIGCLCINMDLTPWRIAAHAIEEITRTDILEENRREDFAADMGAMLEDLLADALQAEGKPAPLMTRENKLNVVRRLNEQGVFKFRKSVETVANALGVSRFTIYNYLKEIESE